MFKFMYNLICLICLINILVVIDVKVFEISVVVIVV